MQPVVPCLRGFASAAPAGTQYAGAAGVMPGGAAFIAAVLCRVRAITGVEQTLFANLDAAGFLGFSIGVIETGTQSVQAVARIGDGAAIQTLTANLGPNAKDKLLLIHLATDGTVANAYRIYANGAEVARATLGTAAAASALAPRVGALDAAGSAPANTCDIVGVAFRNQAGDSEVIGRHFASCHRALGMGRLVPVFGTVDFTNRFDVREGAVVAGAQGTVVNGDLATFPGAAATWNPSAGTASLTRIGPDPFQTQLDGVRANVITNPVWYS